MFVHRVRTERETIQIVEPTEMFGCFDSENEINSDPIITGKNIGEWIDVAETWNRRVRSSQVSAHREADLYVDS